MTTNWLGVEPRHLAALVAVNDEGSFRTAAKRLGLAQSAVSQRISQLESLLDASLIERSRGSASMRLTETGSRLVAHAEEILAEFYAAFADLRAQAADGRPSLRIGAYESVATRLVPPALEVLSDADPELSIHLEETTDGLGFFERVRVGQLDAAFADLPLPAGPFEHRELLVDPCVLVVRADSPLARRREPPALAELVGLQLIAPAWPMLRLAVEGFRAAGVAPRLRWVLEGNAGVQALAAQGVGAAIMPRLAVNENDSRIAVIALDDLLPARRIALYWHRDRRNLGVITQFVDALEATLAALAGPVPELSSVG